VPKLGEFHVAKRQAAPNAEPLTFDFEGQSFRVAEKVGLAPLADFAHAATSGLDTSDMEGLAAMRTMLRQVVVDEDSDRLWDAITRSRADGDDLMPIVQAVMEAQTGRPTEQPSDSSAGLSTTLVSSKESSPFGPGVSPIQRDPRVLELQTVEQAGLSLVG
jgi:hypothetical protein